KPDDVKAMFAHFIDEHRRTAGGGAMTDKEQEELFPQYSRWHTAQSRSPPPQAPTSFAGDCNEERAYARAGRRLGPPAHDVSPAGYRLLRGFSCPSPRPPRRGVAAARG